MSLNRFYLHKSSLVIPTVCETEAGIFIDAAPVRIEKSDDKQQLKAAVYRALAQGNDLIPNPDDCNEPGSAILEKLSIDKWTKFEKESVMYTVHLGSRYISIFSTTRGHDGMWSNSDDRKRQFDPRAPLDYIADALLDDVYAEIDLQERMKRPMLPAAPPAG